MRLSSKKNKVSSLFYLVIPCIDILLLIAMINMPNKQYILEYIFILITFTIISVVYVTIFRREHCDVFHPLTLITGLYVSIFIFCPLYLIYIDETTCKGAYVMDGCIKATTIFLISYLCFIYAYTRKKTITIKPNNLLDIELNNTNKLLICCYAFWILGFVVNILLKVRSGMSLSYILSLGNIGTSSYEFNSYGDEGGIAFLSKSANFMVAPLLVIFFYSKNKIFKYGLLFLTFSCFYITGFRSMIVMISGCMALIYYRKKNEKPSFKVILFIIMLIVIFISILGFARSNLRLGRDIDWQSLKMGDAITYALVNNFNIFLPFYGVVTTYPNEYMFTLGHSMFYETLIYFIPRAIWPAKPVAKISSASAIAIKRSTNEYTISVTGMAWPNLGEYYMEFGSIGCFLFMVLFGYFMRRIINLYNSIYFLDIVLYSMIWSSLLQYITRGYTPNNAGMYAFLFLPIIVFKLILPNSKLQKIERSKIDE